MVPGAGHGAAPVQNHGVQVNQRAEAYEVDGVLFASSVLR